MFSNKSTKQLFCEKICTSLRNVTGNADDVSYTKKGISLEYVIVDFFCMCLLNLWGARTENYKMKNSCSQWDLNPGSFACDATSQSVAQSVQISIEHLNVDRVLPECVFLYCFAVWLIKRFVDCKEWIKCNTRQNILLHMYI